MCPDTRAILPSPFRTHGLVSQPIDSLKMCIFFYYYVDAVPYGAWPHGGVELGLERIVLFYLGVSDVCMASLLPPKKRSPGAFHMEVVCRLDVLNGFVIIVVSNDPSFVNLCVRGASRVSSRWWRTMLWKSLPFKREP
jgi:hypothetical protein